MRAGLTILAALLALQPLPARGESSFWEEMITPGITAHREQVAAAREAMGQQGCEQALPHLSRAIELLPSQAEAHALRGHCLRQLNRNHESAQAFDRAIELDPDVLDNASLAFSFSITLAMTGRYREAADLYQRMLEQGVGPRLRRLVLLNLGDMLVAASCDELDQAIDVYQEGARDYPSAPQMHWGLAAALSRANRVTEAQRELEIALRLDPQWQAITGDGVFFTPAHEIHYYRALGWQQTGHEQQARDEWQAYLDQGGADGCWAESAQARLADTEARPSPRRR